MPGNHRRHTADGALHLGIAQGVARVQLLRTGLGKGRLGLEQRIAHSLYADVAHHVSLMQLRLVVIVHAGRGQTGLGTLAGGDGHLKGSAVGHLIDDEQRLPLAHRSTLAGEDAGDAARHLRAHLHYLPAGEAGAVLAAEGHVLAANHHGAVLGLVVFSLLTLASATAGEEQTGRHNDTRYG